MPEFGGIAYVPRKGRCQGVISKRIIEKGLANKIVELVPSAMGRPITETQTQMLYFAYRELPLIAKTLGFNSVLDIYRDAGIEAKIPDDFWRIYELCKTWKDEKIISLTKMIEDGEFGETWWVGVDNPTDKMRTVVRLHYPLHQRKRIDFGVATDEARRVYGHSFNALTMDALPAISETLNMSLRWMLGVDADAAVYSDRPSVETLFDYYCLLSENHKSVIKKILERGNQDA